jgi:hypothetical protein
MSSQLAQARLECHYFVCQLLPPLS